MKLFKTVLQVVPIVLVAVLAFTAGFLFNESSQIHRERQEKEARRQLVIPPPAEVALLRLESRPYQERLSYTGVVKPWKSATLAFAETGIIATFSTEKGDGVKGPSRDQPGTVLATLDLVRFEANARAARAAVEKALWDKEKTERLYRGGSASEGDLRGVSLIWALKETELARAEKALHDAVLRAPFTGVIADRFIEPGETALPQIPAYRLIQTDRVKVSVSIPGRLINEVQVDQRAEVEVEKRMGEPIILPGKVHSVPPAATGKLFEVEIAVDNRNSILKEGMIARTRIYTCRSRDLFILPLETVIQVGDRRKVMVAEKNGKVIDGFFDLSLLPPSIQTRLAERGWDPHQKTWHDLPRSEWDGFQLTSAEQLKAIVHSSSRSVPRTNRLKGPGIRVYHRGDLARERILKYSRVEGNLCLVPNDGTFREGEILIARGQHRVTEGVEVIESERNELPLPGESEVR